jgi:hypothetical protein
MCRNFCPPSVVVEKEQFHARGSKRWPASGLKSREVLTPANTRIVPVFWRVPQPLASTHGYHVPREEG